MSPGRIKWTLPPAISIKNSSGRPGNCFSTSTLPCTEIIELTPADSAKKADWQRREIRLLRAAGFPLLYTYIYMVIEIASGCPWIHRKHRRVGARSVRISTEQQRRKRARRRSGLCWHSTPAVSIYSRLVLGRARYSFQWVGGTIAIKPTRTQQKMANPSD